MPWAESFSTGVFIHAGSRHDPASLGGLAHFAEHLFFKGTKKQNARQLSVLLESEGGSADAYTSEENTCYHVRGPANQFADLSTLLLEMLTQSVFPADEIERERDVIHEEIAMYREQPSSHAEDMLCQVMWPGHPLGRPIAGDAKSLDRITRKHLLDHVKRYHVPSHIVLAAVGPEPVAVMVEMLETATKKLFRQFAGKTSGKRKTLLKPTRSQLGRGPSLRLDTRTLEQTQMAMGFHAPGRQGAAPYTLKILNVLLGENTSSRLWQEIREKRGWCYQIDTDATTLSDVGLFQIFAGVDPKNTRKALDVIWAELQRFLARPVAEKEVKRAISYAVGAGRLSLEGTASTMLWIGESLLFHGKVPQVQLSQDRLAKVTADQVNALAKRIFQPKNFGAAFVGPEEEQALRESRIFQ